MIERIDGIGGIQPIKGPQGEKVEKSKGKIKDSEKVETKYAKEIASFMERIKEEPEVREKLVEELKELIDKGLYKIDVDAIARRILEGG